MSKNDDFVDEPRPSAPQTSAKTAAPPPPEAKAKDDLAALSPAERQAVDDGIMTLAEINDIKAKARADIMADKKGKLKQDMLAAEKQRLQREEGLTTGNGHQDEILSLTIDLAPYAPYININGQCYYHGRTYQVPRHVADTLRDQMFMTWKHQNQIDGKDAASFYAAKHVAEMYKVAGGPTLSAKGAA